MLILKDIHKHYRLGEIVIEALKGVSIQFRKNEFVSILGPSGCGKTTLLNIIGGLDRYTEGNLAVNQQGTEKFTDSDWDTYRNRRVGFVFQTYNLIPHQTVLSNVELALTLSGVSKAERRRRAIEVLERVGLGDQLYKKPNQISGGQMQRVAIARSLINDPEILLADEPTGALDSETSVQIIDILKEIANDRLVIMVTHNPDIAEKYSTRIVRLLDGKVISDTDPYTGGRADGEITEDTKKQKKPHMSFSTAFSLSINNLLTKKTRTFLTSFAGSIGIIGIALILALSSGMQAYISSVEQDTLSSYPIMIEQVTMNMNAMFTVMGDMHDFSGSREREPGMVYSDDIMIRVINSMLRELQSNDLESFKAFLESEESGIAPLVNDIKYGYSTPLNIFKSDTSDGVVQVNPNQLFDIMGVGYIMDNPGAQMGMPGQAGMMGQVEVWSELHGNGELLAAQYDVMAGRMPRHFDEVVIITDRRSRINDFSLYALGLMDPGKLTDIMRVIVEGNEVESEQVSFTYDELLALTFKLVLNTDFFENINGTWVNMGENEAYMKNVVDNAQEVRVVGVLRPAENSALPAQTSAVGYRPDLMTHLITAVNSSQIVRDQKADSEINVFTGRAFDDYTDPREAFDMTSLTPQQIIGFMTMGEDEIMAMMQAYIPQPRATYEDNLLLLGVSDLNNPGSINIFPKDFASKDSIIDIISAYNARMEAEGKDESVIQYTDFVGLLMSSVSNIIRSISYILIAFVAISLVVSSIMIGIITYISVLERTKEIGILRSIGASKRDISLVFNAETLTVGFVAGMLGIGVTLMLCIPANMIIKALSGIAGVAVLPPAGGVILVVISMTLTLIAGLIPSKIAANKDPVVALRTE
ncbi:MAG: ABC transporter ATP-binding protein/permease [Defluviitaleaceae bacterium]|nr:ABC transporter ATP-binding protein/permease [Defluviitaleaceae bacterium]MCL2835958.1 ABC transporter ATP-binding protein/permease [Defluviitaleaceae bacterium]